MIDGNYELMDWSWWECPAALVALKKNHQKFKKNSGNWTTCGSSTLATVTGLNAGFVERCLPKNQRHWSDTAVVAFLKKREYKIHQLTKLGVTTLSQFGVNFEQMPVTENHVLLCNCLCCINEASWFVISGGEVFHGYDNVSLSPLFFVNKPSQSIWLVKHKKWA